MVILRSFTVVYSKAKSYFASDIYTVFENHLKSHTTTLRVKRATFNVLRFFQPFLPFEKLFRPLKLCLYSKLSIKNNTVEKVYKVLKRAKKVLQARKIFLPENLYETFLLIFNTL